MKKKLFLQGFFLTLFPCPSYLIVLLEIIDNGKIHMLKD
jgi:hypothetical protein